MQILLYTAIGLGLVALIWLIYLEWRLTKLLKGGRPENLESLLSQMRAELGGLHKHREISTRGLEDLDRRLRRSMQGVETVRFDPYPDAGGRSSFSTAIVSEEGDGVVITGLYARGGASVYAKELKAFKSAHELSKEESEALERARRD